jgi:hypothetical protein
LRELSQADCLECNFKYCIHKNRKSVIYRCIKQVMMEALEELASRSPVEYFHVEEGTEELVLTTLWKRLLSAGLVDSQHESILLEQMFDVFDVSVLHGIQSLVVDVFQEVGCLVRACCLSSLTMIYFHADSNRGNFETLRGDDDGMPSSMDRTVHSVL